MKRHFLTLLSCLGALFLAGCQPSAQADAAKPEAAKSTAPLAAPVSAPQAESAVVKVGERTLYYATKINELKLRAAGNPALQQQVDAIVAKARDVLALPVVERGKSLQELKEPGDRRVGGIDARTWKVVPTEPENGELFALAMSDLSTSLLVARELPLVAAAYRLTGEEVFRERVIAQMNEMVTWDPLQRPGWELYAPKRSLPKDGNDGVWLSTGNDLIAIGQMLELMPEDSLPAELRGKIQEQLEREIRRTVRDWVNKVQWFVKLDRPGTNQYVVPSAGLVMACVAAGKEANEAAYELGIRNLQKTLELFGDDGAASEGFTYAFDWTAPFLYMAAISASETGDQRLASAPFLKNFPTWLSLCFQPGGNVINCFDNFGGARGLYPTMVPKMTRIVGLTGSPYLTWILKNDLGEPSKDFYGLLALEVPTDDAKQPPLWGTFDLSHWVAWRSSWANDASGAWVRGRNIADGHRHYDSGHVNFIAHGMPVLIEAGTPGYDDKLKHDQFDSVVGHNILQIGDELFPKRDEAVPITVNRLDAEGGDVILDGTGAYPATEKWQRHVVWTANEITITDTVVLKQAQPFRFFWHLGSEQPLQITNGADTTSAQASLPAGSITFPGWNGNLPKNLDWTPPQKDIVQTPQVAVTIESDVPVNVTQKKAYDHVMKFRAIRHEHTTIVVEPTKPVDRLTVTATFSSPAPAPASTAQVD